MRGRVRALAFLAGLAACAPGEQLASGLEPDTVVTSITLTADQPSVMVGQSVTLRAVGRNASGLPAAALMHWTHEGGSLVVLSDSVAQFSAGDTGAYRVRVEVRSEPFARDSILVQVAQLVSPTVSVTVSPASATLETGATQSFAATATRADGTTYVPNVIWTATGGTVNSSGLYTAGSTAGGFRVIATQQGGTLADTSTVTLSTVPPVLQAVIVTPEIVSLNTGATQQFSVSGQWSDGSTTAPAVTWTATGGTVNASGLYTAGSTAGNFRVIAQQQGGALADTSSLTITAVAPPPGDLGQIPELPTGYNLYRVHTGSSTVPSGWNSSSGTANLSVHADAQAPRSASDILRVTYPAGYSGGGEPTKLWFPLGGVQRIFITYWIRYSGNFEGHSSRVNKHIFLFHATANDYYTTARFSGNASSMYFDIQLQNMTPGFVWLTERPGGVEMVVTKNQWHRVSVESIRQTSGSNGVLRMWVDGTLVGEVTNCQYPSSFSEFQLAPTWGGVGGNVSNTQWFELDEVRVYTP